MEIRNKNINFKKNKINRGRDEIRTYEPLNLQDGCYFCPIVGAEEIGLNLNLFGVINKEKDINDWLIIDMGVAMEKMLGISIKMPSIDYLIHHKLNILGIVCTHAHEDHIGGIPYLLPELEKALNRQVTVYATSFTMYLIKEKLQEHNLKADLQIVETNSSFNIGAFGIQYIEITHSIPEPNMIKITFNPYNYNIVHTGDWKMDYEPIVGNNLSDEAIIKIGDSGIDALICDSTNSLEEEHTLSEGEAKRNLDQIIGQFVGRRVIVTCFASNVARMKSLIDIANKYNRKIVIIGRSLLRMRNASLANNLLEENLDIIQAEQAQFLQPGQVMFIITGSQAEPKSTLLRMAYKSHKQISIREGDVVIFSSRVIPGNEKDIAHLKNLLVRAGARVIDVKYNNNIHVSGHPSRPEIAKMIKFLRPKLVIPVHGDAIHLLGVIDVTKEVDSNILVKMPTNGMLMELTKKPSIKVVDHFNVPILVIDGNSKLEMNSDALKMRDSLSKEGVIFISIYKNNNKIFIKTSTCGILKNSIIKSNQYKENLNEVISKCLNQKIDEPQLIRDIIDIVKHWCANQYKKKPIVLVHIMK